MKRRLAMLQRLRPQVDTWIEPFMGSAALALALEADQAPPFTYQGGKATLARPTLHALGLRPGGRARRYHLNDKGLIAWFYQVLRRRGDEVARHVHELPSGREGFELLVREPPAADEVARAAAYAALQAGTPLGKPPGIVDGRWRTSGYAEVSPTGIELGFTERLNPPILAERLREVALVLADMDVVFTTGCASELPIPEPMGDGRRLVYFDPPYVDTTGYRHDMARDLVVDTARRWAHARVEVVIAEGEALPGGRAVELRRDDGRPLPRDRREYVTLLTSEAA